MEDFAVRWRIFPIIPVYGSGRKGVNNMKKKWLLVLALIAIALTATACGNGGGSSNPLIGTWKNTHSYGISKSYERYDSGEITFKADGTAQSSLPFLVTSNLKYTLIDGGFTAPTVSSREETVFTYELSGNKMFLHEPYGYTWELEKK